MGHLYRVMLVLALAAACLAQVETLPSPGKEPHPGQEPPRSDRKSDESSSRDTRTDISPPKDDAKDHPNSSSSTEEAESAASDVQEFKPWDPHKAAKDVEVGDFYFKKKNYRAALSRYQEALYWKENDAVANFRLGECFEKLNQPDEAVPHYEAYLKILPEGPLSLDAKKALDRLKSSTADTTEEKK